MTSKAIWGLEERLTRSYRSKEPWNNDLACLKEREKRFGVVYAFVQDLKWLSWNLAPLYSILSARAQRIKQLPGITVIRNNTYIARNKYLQRNRGTWGTHLDYQLCNKQRIHVVYIESVDQNFQRLENVRVSRKFKLAFSLWVVGPSRCFFAMLICLLNKYLIPAIVNQVNPWNL